MTAIRPAAHAVPTAGTNFRSAAEIVTHFKVSRETSERLEAFVSTLKKWQLAINLVAPATLPDVWHRHVADSAQLVTLAPPTARTWLDLGSGAGFPGLVVAILLADRPARVTPPSRVTLIESDTRKAAFLREAARASGVAVDIRAERIEQAATRGTVAPVDVVSARALAPLPRLFELAHPFVAPSTVLLLPKGRDVEAELELAIRHWSFEADLVPSLTDPHGRILVVRTLEARPIRPRPA
jgi:16S rRNA (guanine527-N7)-methyltransferase